MEPAAGKFPPSLGINRGLIWYHCIFGAAVLHRSVECVKEKRRRRRQANASAKQQPLRRRQCRRQRLLPAALCHAGQLHFLFHFGDSSWLKPQCVLPLPAPPARSAIPCCSASPTATCSARTSQSFCNCLKSLTKKRKKRSRAS